VSVNAGTERLTCGERPRRQTIDEIKQRTSGLADVDGTNDVSIASAGKAMGTDAGFPPAAEIETADTPGGQIAQDAVPAGLTASPRLLGRHAARLAGTGVTGHCGSRARIGIRRATM
jgi:hypothetical protein